MTWSTSSSNVATVSATGMVTGVGAGTITITASIKGFTGLLTASSTVTVTSTSTWNGWRRYCHAKHYPEQPNPIWYRSYGHLPGRGNYSIRRNRERGLAGGMEFEQQPDCHHYSFNRHRDFSGPRTSDHHRGVHQRGPDCGNGLSDTHGNRGGQRGLHGAYDSAECAKAVSSGGTSNFIALATQGATGLTENVTGSPNLAWSSSIPAVATISSSGVATGVSAGS